MTITAKALLFLLLAGCFNTVFTNAHESNSAHDQKPVPMPADTLQSLLDDYSRKVAVRSGCLRKLDSLNNFLEAGKAIQEGLTEEKKAYQQKLEALDKKPAKEKKTDSVQSLRNYYDSIVDNITIKIAGNAKLRREQEQELERSKQASEQAEKAVAQQIKLIREVADQVSGAKTVMIDNRKYQLFVADTSHHKVRLHLFKKDGKNYFTLGAVLSALAGEKAEAQMITNAGMFTPAFEPEGLFVDGHSAKAFALDTGSSLSAANFYLKPNGVFYMDSMGVFHVETTDQFISHYKPGIPRLKMATQSGPMLVIDGKIHPQFKPLSANLNVRSGVGVISGQKIVFALALDQVNFYDFASFFKDFFNCQDALYLDGAISQMYLRDLAPRVTGGHFGPIISVSKK